MDGFVCYRIYHRQYLDVSTTDDAAKSSMQQLGQSLLQCVTNQSKDYLWSKDCFHIEPYYISQSADPKAQTTRGSAHKEEDYKLSHFKGTLRYGRDINDEWFTVYLLYQISKHFADVVIEVSDNDGQFLLIHSALHLPQWVDPYNVRNRVYIHNQQLHLIPLIHDVTNNKRKSIELILDSSTNTVADESIQHSVHQKLHQINESVHRNPGVNYHFAVVVLPKSCALILRDSPWIIGHVVDSFITETEQNQNQNGIRHRETCHFTLDPMDYVFVSIRFTRYLYAILGSKPLKSAPIRFRKCQFDHCAYSNSHKYPQQMVQSAFINGIKLMIGFEALYTRCKLESDESTQWQRDNEWKQFKKSLVKKGYFRDCTLGSDEYRVKEDGAKQYYLETMKCKDGDRGDVMCIEGGVCPDELHSVCLKVMEEGEEQKKCGQWVAVYDETPNPQNPNAQNPHSQHTNPQNPHSQHPNHQNPNIEITFESLRNDQDDWMRISNQELEAVLSEYCYDNNPVQRQMLFEELLEDEDGPSSDGDKEEMAQQTKDDILSLKESMNSFMERQSSVDGVEDMKNVDNEDGIGFDADLVMEILNGARMNAMDSKQNEMREMMEQMDQELSQKQKKQIDQKKERNEEGDGIEEDEQDGALDIDLSAVNDILQSHLASQAHDSGFGPAATLLSQMGLQLK